MKKVHLKRKKHTMHPIMTIIESKQKKEENSIIQLNSTKITLEPTDKVTIKDNCLIIGKEKEPETVININHVIYVS